jgi:hypothetical protein
MVWVAGGDDTSALYMSRAGLGGGGSAGASRPYIKGAVSRGLFRSKLLLGMFRDITCKKIAPDLFRPQACKSIRDVQNETIQRFFGANPHKWTGLFVWF